MFAVFVYVQRNFFGAVAGSIPIAVVLAIAIPVLTLINLIGAKMKGEAMETRTTADSMSKSDCTKTTATKCLNYSRKPAGQALLVIAAMGSSMTAGAAGHQLSART